MEPERSKEEERDSDGSTGYTSISPGAATQASAGEVFSGFPGVDVKDPSLRKDSATQVILNLCAMVDRNGGEFGLPPQVAMELSGPLSMGPEIQDSQAQLDAQEEVSRRLREELARTRRELKQLKSLNGLSEGSLQDKLAAIEAREVELQRRSEEFEEQAKRQEETASLQKHILEVEMKRCAEELRQSHSKVEALEKELKTMAQAQKAHSRSRRSSEEAVHRHQIAVRASFEDSRENVSPSRRPPSKEEKPQGWFSCCSVQKTPHKK